MSGDREIFLKSKEDATKNIYILVIHVKFLIIVDPDRFEYFVSGIFTQCLISFFSGNTAHHL